jgi:hypothetical protein
MRRSAATRLREPLSGELLGWTGAVFRWLLTPVFLFAAFVATPLLWEASRQGMADGGARGPLWFWVGLISGSLVYHLLSRRSRMAIYVFGHELTHAFWAKVFGARVLEFKVGSGGGHVVLSHSNWWVVLAPYFFPLYSLALLVAVGILSVFWELPITSGALLFALGLTWGFHLISTARVIAHDQSDLRRYGRVFSLCLIYLLNLALFLAVLTLISPHITFPELWQLGRDSAQRALDYLSALWAAW